jgi:hypothetical protein
MEFTNWCLFFRFDSFRDYFWCFPFHDYIDWIQALRESESRPSFEHIFQILKHQPMKCVNNQPIEITIINFFDLSLLCDEFAVLRDVRFAEFEAHRGPCECQIADLQSWYWKSMCFCRSLNYSSPLSTDLSAVKASAEQVLRVWFNSDKIFTFQNVIGVRHRRSDGLRETKNDLKNGGECLTIWLR